MIQSIQSCSGCVYVMQISRHICIRLQEIVSKALASIVEAISSLKKLFSQVTVLSGGCENNLYLSGKTVLRTPKKMRPPADFEKSLSISQQASDRGIGPLLQSFEKEKQEMCMQYIDHTEWPVYKENPAPYHATMKALRIFHDTVTIDTQSKAYSPFDFIFSYFNSFDQKKLPQQFIEAINKMQRIYERLKPWLKKNAVLCHGDFHKGNVLIEKTTQKAFLIDFDCAALGHPFFDIAKFSLALSKDERLHLLQSYLGKKPTRTQLRHFAFLHLATLMVIAVNRYRWGQNGKLQKDDMEKLFHKKDNPSFLQVSFKDPSDEGKQRAAVFALQEFFARFQELT